MSFSTLSISTCLSLLLLVMTLAPFSSEGASISKGAEREPLPLSGSNPPSFFHDGLEAPSLKKGCFFPFAFEKGSDLVGKIDEACKDAQNMTNVTSESKKLRMEKEGVPLCLFVQDMVEEICNKTMHKKQDDGKFPPQLTEANLSSSVSSSVQTFCGDLISDERTPETTEVRRAYQDYYASFILQTTNDKKSVTNQKHCSAVCADGLLGKGVRALCALFKGTSDTWTLIAHPEKEKEDLPPLPEEPKGPGMEEFDTDTDKNEGGKRKAQAIKPIQTQKKDDNKYVKRPDPANSSSSKSSTSSSTSSSTADLAQQPLSPEDVVPPLLKEEGRKSSSSALASNSNLKGPSSPTPPKETDSKEKEPADQNPAPPPKEDKEEELPDDDDFGMGLGIGGNSPKGSGGLSSGSNSNSDLIYNGKEPRPNEGKTFKYNDDPNSEDKEKDKDKVHVVNLKEEDLLADPQETGSLHYFIFLLTLLALAFLLFHNKRRLLAYIVEGKKPRASRSRRRSSSASGASYRRLENNFE